jgi:hypothetical protein
VPVVFDVNTLLDDDLFSVLQVDTLSDIGIVWNDAALQIVGLSGRLLSGNGRDSSRWIDKRLARFDFDGKEVLSTSVIQFLGEGEDAWGFNIINQDFCF